MAVWVFSPGLTEEASLAPSLIWPGRSGLGASAALPHPPLPLRPGATARHLGRWGCRGPGWS